MVLPTIPDDWPNRVVHQKLKKYLMADMAAKLNSVDAAGYSHSDGLPLKWDIVDAELDANSRYGGAIWITYQ